MQAMWLMGIYSLMQFFFSPVLGRWSDRIGRRPVIIASLVGSMLGYLIIAQAENPGLSMNGKLSLALLFTARVVTGICGASFSTAQAYLADITAPEKRAGVMGMIGAAFDPSELAVVTGGPEAAVALLEERFDHVFFTGSTGTGRKVAAAAARHLTPVTLELGGKCPVLVFGGDEAGTARLKDSMDVVARRIAWGKHLNAGQTCVAPDHVLVDRRLHDPLVEALGRAFKSFEGGEYGRLVSRRHFDRVLAFLGDGTIASGGDSDAERLHLEPTVLTGVSAESPVMSDEIFGPVLPVLSFESLDDALALVRSRPDPLAVYVFSKDDGVVERVAASTRSGGVRVNDTVVHITGFELPFGGVGDSGMGRYRGKAGFDTFTRERVVLRRGLWPDLPFRYPSPKQTLAALKKLPRFLRGG
jgi:aldehyde dehydrogenase (NAD+)